MRFVETNIFLYVITAHDKSQAINKLAKQYKLLVLESQVRPEYLKKLDKIHKEPIIRIGNARDFKRKYGPKCTP